jgi:CelD/BcsL family acetyltransferase involved in cellulose biosynthesis
VFATSLHRTKGAPTVAARRTPSTGRSFTVAAVTSEQEFDALEPAWTALFDAFGTFAFQSFEWNRTWWRHFGEADPARTLEILVVTDGDEVAAIAPFFVEALPVLGTIPVRRLFLIARDHSDYLEPLVRADDAAECLQALAGHLWSERNAFDMLIMESLPDHSPSAEGWVQALTDAGFTCTRTAGDACPRASFGATWDETLAALPGATRGKMTRRMRHLARRHDAVLELAQDPAQVDKDVDDFIELHQQRWIAAGYPGAFADEQFAAFIRDAAREQARRGRLVLAFLRIDGQRKGAICGFRHGNEFDYYLGGMGDAGDAMRYSPGIALHLWCMEAMFERGVRVYDFLRGTESYKADLGGVAAPTWTIAATGRPYRLGRTKHQAHLVQSKVLNRLAIERRLLREERSGASAETVGVRRHLTRRIATAWNDALGKVRGAR